MTNDEFSKWLAYFDACFPSYAEKRNRLADKSTTLVAWYKLFAGVSLRHAMVATDAALKEEIPGITSMTPWDKYPQFIRAKARQVASQAAGSAAGPSFRKRGPDGEITYACIKCSDTGWREVVSAKSLQDARNFEPWMESVLCGLRSLLVTARLERSSRHGSSRLRTTKTCDTPSTTRALLIDPRR